MKAKVIIEYDSGPKTIYVGEAYESLADIVKAAAEALAAAYVAGREFSH